ncbi:MAG TPA: ABC transporter substrate-binding protein [Candidatus Binatia bacterium]|jgi:ABC-type nitrate/sulfonate/bicarbonate transport system substrate-binding protein|nr:ABC transporter substrate-binding protein [Candidatus Binatia bacterium]
MARILILVLAVVIAALAPSALRAQPLQRAVITYSSRSIASVDLFIAQERGFFREEGIEPQLVQISANAAIAATVSGDVQALGSVGSAIRAIQRGVPIKVLAVSLHRPLFWLVTRPDLKSFADLKGKVAATTTIGGSQHTAGIRMLRRAGIDPDKDITVMTAGDVPTQLKAMVSGTIQIGFFSPPSVIIARDKYKMNVLASAMDEFSSLQNGLGMLEKNLKEQRELARRMLRARAKGNRYFHQNERGSAEVLAKYLNVDMPTALETYRISLPAFTTNGIPSDDEIREYLKMDAQIIGLPAPVPAEKIFDFALQREVNKELGMK